MINLKKLFVAPSSLWANNAYWILIGMAAGILVLVFLSQIFLLKKTDQELRALQQQSGQIERLAADIKQESQSQHDTLFHQVECLAEVSVVAARGNDVTVTDLEDCKYKSVPKVEEQARVIIQPQTIREFHTETQIQTELEQPGKAKGKKK